MKKQIPLCNVRIDGDTQIRTNINKDYVTELCELLTAGQQLPPITVIYDGTNYWCADGFHRVLASERNKVKLIDAEIRNGTLDDARWFATGANQSHGLRRSNADKQNAVRVALELHPEMSDRGIAKHVGVSDKTVTSARPKNINCETFAVDQKNNCGISAVEKPNKNSKNEVKEPEKRVGLDGKTRRMPTPKPKDPEAVLDKFGRKVPMDMLAGKIWNRKSEVEELLRLVSTVRTIIASGAASEDQLWMGVNHQSIKADGDNLYSAIKEALPVYVCPSCQGLHGCKLCKGRGVVSEFVWKTLVPKEMKKK